MSGAFARAPRPRVHCSHCGQEYAGVPAKDGKGYTVRRHETRELLATSPSAITPLVVCPGSYKEARLVTRGLR